MNNVMNGEIISTRNTNTKYKNTGIICAILMSVLGLAIIGGYCYLSEHSSDDSLIWVLLFGLFLFADGIITTTFRNINASSYVDIYQDRFIGKGIQNLSPLNFNLRIEDIINVSTEGIWLHIHTNSGKYKVMTNESTAMRIFNYYHGLKK